MVMNLMADQRWAAQRSTVQVFASAEAERHERQDELLDEALLETFPASDPVSVVRVS